MDPIAARTPLLQRAIDEGSAMSRLVVVSMVSVCMGWGCQQQESSRSTEPADQAAGTPAASPAGTPAEANGEPVMAASAEPAPTGVHAFVMKDIDGGDRPLAEFHGKALLIVNVASACGYTPQYAGLQELYTRYRDRGLVVLGVPSNDFGQQEPGTNEEIKAFCSTKFRTTFPMLSKVSVKEGPEQVPLYRFLTDSKQNGVLDATVSWNFNKFLIGRDGRPIRHYVSKVKPDDEQLIADIEAALQADD
jgi:glutathione peroxidase